jgi:hypothetical protein
MTDGHRKQSRPMGITALIFEEQVAPADGDLFGWITAERAAAWGPHA